MYVDHLLMAPHVTNQKGCLKNEDPKTLKTQKLGNELSTPKPSIWLTLGPTTCKPSMCSSNRTFNKFRVNWRISQIEGFGVLYSLPSFQDLKFFVFETPDQKLYNVTTYKWLMLCM